MSISSRLRATLALAAALGLPHHAGAQSRAMHRAATRLVVFVTVDQMRPDYLDRWERQLTGGLGRFAHRGAFFTNAYQDHAITETAPGHATTLSGRFPRSTGIVRNSAGVEDPQSPLLTSNDPGASPYRFRGSTLIDWMRRADARSRALSVSRKDRGAILPLGRAHQDVFWYATTSGEFTTSHYYMDTLPAWIERVNARRFPEQHAGRAWTLLLPADEYPEPDTVPEESGGRGFTFPHVLSPDGTRAAAELPGTPWMDELTLDAALEGVQALGLGRGPAPDLLAISLSATDYVGHRYGPDSREQHDNILRLDRALGAFIDSLYRLRDSSTIEFALTADHGVTPYPELVAKRAHHGAPPRYDTSPAVKELRESLRRARVDESAIEFDGALVTVDQSAFARARADPEPILDRFARALRGRPGIARVDRVADLVHRDTVNDAISRRWVHMIPPDLSVALVVTPVQGDYPVGVTAAMHGSPYDADAHVPLIFYGPAFRSGRVSERAFVVDAAPTLAFVIGVPPTERLDGHVLEQALAPPPDR